jgi:hypothetical protein
MLLWICARSIRTGARLNQGHHIPVSPKIKRQNSRFGGRATQFPNWRRSWYSRAETDLNASKDSENLQVDCMGRLSFEILRDLGILEVRLSSIYDFAWRFACANVQGVPYSVQIRGHRRTVKNLPETA